MKLVKNHIRDVLNFMILILTPDDGSQKEEVRREARQSFAALIMLTGVALILFGAFLHIRSSLTLNTEWPAEYRSPDKIDPYR